MRKLDNPKMVKAEIGVDVNGNPVIYEINASTYWGCMACDAEFIVDEIPPSDDRLCSQCRNDLYNSIIGLT
jgi:hypothetical protein